MQLISHLKKELLMIEANTNAADSGVKSAPSRLLYLLVAVLVAFGLYSALVTAPAMRANARTDVDRAIASENLAFCEKIGMRAGTSQFDVCTQELAVIRQKQTERDRAEAAGLL
jgi:hypothetical protein